VTTLPPPDLSRELAIEAAIDLDDVETPRARVIRRFRQNRVAMLGLAVLLLIMVIAVVSLFWTPQDADHLTARGDLGPSGAHWLGTDHTGRDLASRLMVAARASMEVGLIVVVLATAAALPLGLVAGYFGGRTDYLIMRFMDALFAFPAITLAIAITTLLLQGASSTKSFFVVGIAIAVTFTPGLVRLVRSQVVAVREETFIEASRSVGVSEGRMVRRHVLPNVISPMIVQGALTFGYAILAEAGLSFLGFGVQPPTPSWGTMLQEGYNQISKTQWPIIPPGLAIMLTVLAINLVADGLRDTLGREVFVVKEPT
jgi:peptide/nickel transport system permease protein